MVKNPLNTKPIVRIKQKMQVTIPAKRLSENPSDSAGGLGSGICADPPISTASRRGAMAVDTSRNGAVNRACGSRRGTIIRRRPRGRWWERRGSIPRTLTDLTEAEWQMLMILREEAASEGLKITIIAEPGQWHVRLESHEQGSSGDGGGHDFTSAWEDIVDPRLRAKAKKRD
jgi:hypothetical protein